MELCEPLSESQELHFSLRHPSTHTRAKRGANFVYTCSDAPGVAFEHILSTLGVELMKGKPTLPTEACSTAAKLTPASSR